VIVTAEIITERLRLIPLTLDQLRNYLADPGEVERQLKLEVSRDILTDRLRRAIEMKVAKMERADRAEHAWYTYWLIVVEEQHYGAGLAGYKGLPDEHGEIEIGYGIDGAYRNRGFMTEAVRGLIAWAFQDESCTAVIAPDTKRWNKASNRVLEKAGMRVYNETEGALDWRVDRQIRLS
jgi:ribosomal-protein-alanine N-acetyltransferase